MTLPGSGVRALNKLDEFLWGITDHTAWAHLDEIAETVTAMGQRDPDYADFVDSDNVLTDAGARYVLGLFYAEGDLGEAGAS